jgi:Domain of unknown function (DUF397)
MNRPDFSKARWRKSNASGDGGCVEVAYLDGVIGVRDTKDNGAGPVLMFTQLASSRPRLVRHRGRPSNAYRRAFQILPRLVVPKSIRSSADPCAQTSCAARSRIAGIAHHRADMSRAIVVGRIG